MKEKDYAASAEKHRQEKLSLLSEALANYMTHDVVKKSMGLSFGSMDSKLWAAICSATNINTYDSRDSVRDQLKAILGIK